MKKIKQLLQQIQEQHIEEYATSCAYYTILSFIPLMMLVLTLTKYVGLEKQSLFFVFEQFLPQNMINNAVLEIIREIYAKSIGTITFSILFTLWSATKGFLALCKGIHAMYGVEEDILEMKSKIRALLFTIIFTAMVVFSLMILIFGNSIYSLVQDKFYHMKDIVETILKLKHIAGIVFLSILFSLLYRFALPNKVVIRRQMPGAIVAAIACHILSSFYAMYVDIFKGFSILYGSLTTIILAMMWIYGCMYCILLGANLNQMRWKNVVKKEKMW